MSDEPTAPDEVQDQPTPTDDATPEVQAPEAEETEAADLESFDLAQVPDDADRDWFEARYGDLRADYTRKTQELADQRRQVQAVIEAVQDPSHPQHEEVMDYLGLEAVEDEDDFDGDEFDDDPLAPLQAQIAELREAEQQRQEMAYQQQAEAELEDYLETEILDLQRSEGIDEFSESELRFLVNDAVANSNPDGTPNVKEAWETLKSIKLNERKALVSSKGRASRAPGAGVPASAELDVTNRSDRLAEAARIAEAAFTSE